MKIDDRIQLIDVAAIHVGERRFRDVTDAGVAKVMESIKRMGMGVLPPIHVRREEDAVVLVAGAHRVEAAKRLGQKKIQAIFLIPDDDLEARECEILENFGRNDLTNDQRRTAAKELKSLWDSRSKGKPPPHATVVSAKDGQEVVAHDAPKPQGGRPEGFAAANAAKLGKSKSQINRLLAAPKPKPAQPAPPAPPLLRGVLSAGRSMARLMASVEQQVEALETAWNKAGPKARDIFKERHHSELR